MKKQLILAGLLSLFVLTTYAQVFEKQGAGVTILVHGWDPDGNQPAWMSEMANAIVQRNGGVGHIDTITVSGSQGNLTATCSDWDFELLNQNHAEIIILVNWTDVANHLSTGVTAQEVAAAVVPRIYNEQNGEPALAELPLHLIGHSRGGGMVFEIARLIGLEGVEVEHVTALDPHPLTSADPQGADPPFGPGPTIDTAINVHENILFADCYYQNIEYPTGEYVSGAYNRLWENLPGGYHNETGYTYDILNTDYNFSDHLNIILAYHGTIDLSTPATNGEATLTQTERDDWFNAYENEGENTGFKYSPQIRGDRKSTDAPVPGGDQIIDGYHNDILLGGNGARESLDWTNAIWPNILEFTLSKNSSVLVAGTHSLTDGDVLGMNVFYRSYVNAGTITFYIDLDRNPYNDNKTEIGTVNISATGSVITSHSTDWTTSGLATGETYYVYAKINDSSNSRFFYAPYEFEYEELPVNDLSVTDIVKPVKHFENSEITMQIMNYGNQTETNIPVSYTFDGDTVTETFTGTLNPGDSVLFTFDQSVDLSEENIHEIYARTELPGDVNTGNDEFITEINTHINPNTLFFIYDDYVSIPEDTALCFTDNFTIETWFYAHSTKSAGKVISKHGNDGINRSGYTIEYDGSNIRAVIGVGPDWATVEAGISNDQWYHVAMVYSGGILEMYLNGISQGTAMGTIVTNDLDLYIGGSQQYGDYWTGYIDETRIWNIARTDTEIQENFHTEIDPQSGDLLAYYDFNRGIPEGDNTAIEILPDMTDNNFHGTLNNFYLQAGMADGNFIEDCGLDITMPVPDETTLPTVTGECAATVTETPTATDNCSGAITGTTADALTYTEQGISTITWTYDDGNGNTSEQTQNVVIEDTTAPVPDETSLPDVTAECEITTLTTPTATDNCAGEITGTHDVTLPITTDGTIVTWTYDDGNGNTSEQTQNVVIEDATDPVPDETSLPDVTAECEITTLTTPTATDNCAGEITGTHDVTLPITTQGTTVVTWTYDDGNGNIETQEQTVIVEDIINPTITCVENQTIDLNESETFYTVQGAEFDPIADDNCGVETLENDHNSTESLAGEEFNAGTHTITWTVTDNAGNIADCSFEITVNAYVRVSDLSVNGLNIYPNPTTGIFTIDFSGSGRQENVCAVEITNISGNTIMSVSNHDISAFLNYEIDLSDQPSGIYLLKIEFDKKTSYHKIIKN